MPTGHTHTQAHPAVAGLDAAFTHGDVGGVYVLDLVFMMTFTVSHLLILAYFHTLWAWGDSKLAVSVHPEHILKTKYVQGFRVSRVSYTHSWTTRRLTVPWGRLELPILSEYASETYVYTNSTTTALSYYF